MVLSPRIEREWLGLQPSGLTTLPNSANLFSDQEALSSERRPRVQPGNVAGREARSGSTELAGSFFLPKQIHSEIQLAVQAACSASRCLYHRLTLPRAFAPDRTYNIMSRRREV